MRVRSGPYTSLELYCFLDLCSIGEATNTPEDLAQSLRATLSTRARFIVGTAVACTNIATSQPTGTNADAAINGYDLTDLASKQSIDNGISVGSAVARTALLCPCIHIGLMSGTRAPAHAMEGQLLALTTAVFAAGDAICFGSAFLSEQQKDPNMILSEGDILSRIRKLAHARTGDVYSSLGPSVNGATGGGNSNNGNTGTFSSSGGHGRNPFVCSMTQRRLTVAEFKQILFEAVCEALVSLSLQPERFSVEVSRVLCVCV